ncbi:MAG: ATP-dependent helicase, partial [Lachnospiraceae bacterium]|nr:ATP-dependent helicase [Lachnospiraceae bacterium]
MFNEEQMRAINHDLGAAMVLAGPGTGKTTVLTERIKRLVQTGIASEEELLVVTFTKAAAVEMQQRYEKKVSTSDCRITFGTFHSVFFRILRESNPAFRGMSILKEDERVKLIREIVLRLGIEYGDIYEFVKNIASEISRVNGRGTKISEFVSNVCESDTFVAIYREYEKALIFEKKIDFDDMVSKCHELLKEDVKIRKFWQDRFRFIMIDEFQDINMMQYETIQFLVGKEQNIFVVGDDDQAIYGFRGSDNQIMFDFKKRFSNVKIISLKVNYRSTRQIVECAFNLIEHNSRRFNKSVRAYKGDGDNIEIVEFDDNIVQYRHLAEQVSDYVKRGVKPNQIAILVRNNGTIPLIRNFFLNQNIKLTVKYKNNVYKS